MLLTLPLQDFNPVFITVAFMSRVLFKVETVFFPISSLSPLCYVLTNTSMVFMLAWFKIRPVSLSSAFAYCLYLISFDPELQHNECPYQILNYRCI